MTKWIFIFVLYLGLTGTFVLADCRTGGCPSGFLCHSKNGILGCYPLTCAPSCTENQTCKCKEKSTTGETSCNCETNCHGLICTNRGDSIYVFESECICKPSLDCPNNPCAQDCNTECIPGAISKTLCETKTSQCVPNGNPIVRTCQISSQSCSGSNQITPPNILPKTELGATDHPKPTQGGCIPNFACNPGINNCQGTLPPNYRCLCVKSTCNDGCTSQPFEVCNTVCIPNNCGYKISNCFGAAGCKCHVDSTCDNGCGGTDSVMICEPIITPSPPSTLPLPTN